MEKSQEKWCQARLCSLGRQVRELFTFSTILRFFFIAVGYHYLSLLMWLIFGEMMSRCYDDGVRVDEELYPALNDESNPVLKNKKVS